MADQPKVPDGVALGAWTAGLPACQDLRVIVVEGLSKRYAGFTAVDDVTFECRRGRVTGFLGPNGAGKTTTMRILVGLTPPTSGSALIGGHRYVDIPNPGRHVGVLLDASAQHAGRTGREVLRLGARTMGLPDSRVDEMLEMVSLTRSEAKKRVRAYSLGMRQRLGIAHALLGDPSVLILDEPANGLDPAGIRWMRGLLADYAERGGTVLLSSHLLHEVEQVADQIILIGNGRILAQGDPRSLGHAAAGASSYAVTTDNEAFAAALQGAGLEVTADGDGLEIAAEPRTVGEQALAHGAVLLELRRAGGGLEELFLDLTSDTQRERPAAAVASEGSPA